VRALFVSSEIYPLAKTGGLADVSAPVPIVRRIGGLTDTIVDANDETNHDGTATGFAVEEALASHMIDVVDRALAAYRPPVIWRRLQRTAMTQDFGWERSARHYLALYQRAAPTAALPDRDTLSLERRAQRATEMERDLEATMAQDRQAEIQRRAYLIWEREGHPEGKALEHWRRAEAEIAESALAAAPSIQRRPAARRKRTATRTSKSEKSIQPNP
jgi:DUF2934 family protein/glycosyl transferase family 5 (putative starch synthase catalytic subunit)